MVEIFDVSIFLACLICLTGLSNLFCCLNLDVSSKNHVKKFCLCYYMCVCHKVWAQIMLKFLVCAVTCMVLLM